MSDAFCKHLQRLDPSPGPVFDGELVVQRMRVGAALAGLVGSLGHLGRFQTALGGLGRQRVRQGVVPEHYAMVEEALMAALREVLGDQFDAGTRHAWLLAYGQVFRIMTKDASDERVSAQAARNRCAHGVLGLPLQEALRSRRRRRSGVNGWA